MRKQSSKNKWQAKKVTVVRSHELTYHGFKLTDCRRHLSRSKPVALDIIWEHKNAESVMPLQTETSYHKTIAEALAHLYEELGYEG